MAGLEDQRSSLIGQVWAIADKMPCLCLVCVSAFMIYQPELSRVGSHLKFEEVDLHGKCLCPFEQRHGRLHGSHIRGAGKI